jgi:hypothetical protein
MDSEPRKKTEFFPFKMTENECKPVLKFLKEIKQRLQNKHNGKHPNFQVDSRDLEQLEDFFTNVTLRNVVYLESELWAALHHTYNLSNATYPPENFLNKDEEKIFFEFIEKMAIQSGLEFTTQLPEEPKL